MSNQPFNAAQHPRIGDGTFTAAAHSDNVPALEPAANRFAGLDSVRFLDAAALAALSPLGSNPGHDNVVRAEWEERRTQLVHGQQRKAYDDYATALEEQAETILANAARANLRNIADELREEFPDADTMTLEKDYDGDSDMAVWVSAVQDKDGNKLPEADTGEGARETAQELISRHSSEQLAQFADGPINLAAAAEWYPDGGLHLQPWH